MKKLFAFLAVFGMLNFAGASAIFAQEEEAVSTEEQTEAVVEEVEAVEEVAQPVSEVDEEALAAEEQGIHKQIKSKFIEGGAMFMSFVLLALIFGLAICIERIIYLNLSTQ